MKRYMIVLLLAAPAWTYAADCAKAAEGIALAEARKTAGKGPRVARQTERVTDAETLQVYGVKADEESFTTQVHDEQGAFVVFEVVVKKKGCAKVSVKVTGL